MHQDRAGRVWLATDGGLVRYVRRTQQPLVRVESVGSDRMHETAAVVRLQSGTQRVRFSVQGAGSGLLERLVYRYRLFGHDQTWHQTRERHVEYADPESGSYDFVVQAVDSDLNYSSMASVKVVVSEEPWNALLATASVSRRRGLPPRSARLLLVDSDVGYTASLRKLMARVGHQTEVRSSVAAAAGCMPADACDLILLRAVPQIPQLLRLVWAFRGRDASLDVLLLASADSYAAAQECSRLGAAGHVLRTAAPQELVDRIDAALMSRWDPIAGYMRSHTDGTGSRWQIAKLFDVSPGTVLNHVTRCTGTSFARYQRRVRIERAMGVLVHTHLSIKQIAGRVGMSPAAFARAFKQVSGLTPLQFRRAARMPA
jgi:AraC-like DNA-binding protein